MGQGRGKGHRRGRSDVAIWWSSNNHLQFNIIYFFSVRLGWHRCQQPLFLSCHEVSPRCLPGELPADGNDATALPFSLTCTTLRQLFSLMNADWTPCFHARYVSFHIRSFILTFFLRFFVLVHAFCFYVQVFKRKLMHEVTFPMAILNITCLFVR